LPEPGDVPARQACLDTTFPAALANLGTILDTLQTVAPGVPIVGSDYADVFLGLWVFGSGGQAAALANVPIVDALNEGLASAYEAAGVPVADVSGAFGSDDFTDTVSAKQWGTIPVNVANICLWTWFCDDKYTFDVHANSEGYQVIADAFRAALP
jgi:lysophospholipase L1-like esterase